MNTIFSAARHAAALLLSVTLTGAAAFSAAAQDSSALDDLQKEMDQISRRMAELEKSGATAPGGNPGKLRLIDSSVDLLVVAGASTEDDHGVEELQGGGHDPKRRGFTLQQAELSFAGAVDPYFKGETHIVLLEDEIELEEAFLTSTALPADLELEAGFFLTEFGRINPTHPHVWKWIDQPVIASRLLGGEGTRGAGARLGWLTPLPWYSQVHLGLQNADNDTMVSFLGEGHDHGDENGEGEEEPAHAGEYEETVAGLPRMDRDTDGLEDLLLLARWANFAEMSDETSGLLGLSLLSGPNATGDDGQTLIYGADLTVKWKPARNQRGWPFVTWQTEFMRRDFESDDAALVLEDGDELFFPSETVEDWGLYSQLLWGFTPGWEAGVRVDYATGNEAGVEEREADPARSDRLRVSPLLAWWPSEFSRVRLQYNYDDTDFLEDGEAHTVWMGLEVLYGAHPAHAY